MIGKYAVGLIIFVFVGLTYFAMANQDIFDAILLTFFLVAIFFITLYCAVSGVYFLEMYGVL